MATNFCPQCATPRDPAHNACSNCGYVFAATPALSRPPVAAARPSGRRRLWLIIGGLVAFLCAASWLSNRGDSPPTPVPPRAVAPTAVPARAANTPVPAAARAGLTAAEGTYSAAVQDQSTRMGAALEHFGVQMGNVDLTSDAWKIDTAVYMVEIQNIAKEARALTAPARFKTVDQYYQAGMADYSRAMDLVAQGIDADSAAILRQANTAMTEGQTAIARAVAEMGKATK